MTKEDLLRKCLDKNDIPSKRRWPKFETEIVELTINCNGPIRERLYWIKTDLVEYPKCIVCESNCSFQNYNKGYSNWCSITCRNKDLKIRNSISEKNSANKVTRSQKMKKTLLARYGVDAVLKIPKIKIQVHKKMTKFWDQIHINTFQKYNLDIEKFSNYEYLISICNNSSYPDISEKYFNNMPIMTIYRHFEKINFDPKFEKTSSS